MMVREKGCNNNDDGESMREIIIIIMVGKIII